jgi:DNA-binding GntR family transcriptional regulator
MIITAIRERDEEAAVKAMVFHIDASRSLALGNGRSVRDFAGK